ncbi:MAG: NAD(P)H-binding protein [Planctomycetota bacterium]|nr:NAD(P)H-binding protein [Planctomycetota bacterium]
MKIAITGGTGLVGAHLARRLTMRGHSVVLISRGIDRRDEDIRTLPGSTLAPIGIGDETKLTEAFAGCDGVAHCAGINREMGEQTYRRVHVEGTRNVVNAARRAGVGKVLLLSFLRARPDCGSPYHESKWAAEEIVRSSGLDYTVIKSGVIYGRGDHMLDHLSRAFHTFPIFGLVGFRALPMRPVAIEEVGRVLEASLIDGDLSRSTVAVLGPEELTMPEAVRRVADVVGERPRMIPLPVALHRLIGWVCERAMTIPLVSLAQVRILTEGLVEPHPPCDPLPDRLRPKLSFSEEQIRRGLPAPGRFGWSDLRWCARRSAAPAMGPGPPSAGS